jgi:hypothetical protein
VTPTGPVRESARGEGDNGGGSDVSEFSLSPFPLASRLAASNVNCRLAACLQTERIAWRRVLIPPFFPMPNPARQRHKHEGKEGRAWARLSAFFFGTWGSFCGQMARQTNLASTTRLDGADAIIRRTQTGLMLRICMRVHTVESHTRDPPLKARAGSQRPLVSAASLGRGPYSPRATTLAERHTKRE